MIKKYPSEGALTLLLALLSIVLASIFTPVWQGDTFLGKSSLEFEPSAVGRAAIFFQEMDWGWWVPLPLPLSAELKVSDIQITADQGYRGLFLAVLPILGILMLSAGVFGLIWRSAKLAWRIFALTISLLALSFLFALSWSYFLEPQHFNEESGAVLNLLEDYKSSGSSPAEKMLIPGQELVTPGSPYYGGSLLCKRDGCQLQAPNTR